MSADQIFQWSTALVMGGWLALFVSPVWPVLTDRIATYLVPVLLSVAYTGLILAFWSGAEGGFDTLDNVALLFETRELLLAGWLHFLALDLFVGAWIVRTARAEGLPFWLAACCLPPTFLFGPAGYFCFVILRAVLRRPAVQAAL